MKRTLHAILAGATLAASSVGYAACSDDSAKDIRTSNMDDQGKVNMLRAMGCDTSDLVKKMQSDFQTGLEINRKHNEQVEAKLKADREAKQKKSLDDLNAQIEVDNAQRDAFDQEMADKCGEYPLDLKIGLKAKLLAMGCAGQADLQAEDINGAKVYFTAYYMVSVKGGKVVRLIRR